jgi:hypothetical protein
MKQVQKFAWELRCSRSFIGHWLLPELHVRAGFEDMYPRVFYGELFYELSRLQVRSIHIE